MAVRATTTRGGWRTCGARPHHLTCAPSRPPPLPRLRTTSRSTRVFRYPVYASHPSCRDHCPATRQAGQGGAKPAGKGVRGGQAPGGRYGHGGHCSVNQHASSCSCPEGALRKRRGTAVRCVRGDQICWAWWSPRPLPLACIPPSSLCVCVCRWPCAGLANSYTALHCSALDCNIQQRIAIPASPQRSMTRPALARPCAQPRVRRSPPHSHGHQTPSRTIRACGLSWLQSRWPASSSSRCGCGCSVRACASWAGGRGARVSGGREGGGVNAGGGCARAGQDGAARAQACVQAAFAAAAAIKAGAGVQEACVPVHLHKRRASRRTT